MTSYIAMQPFIASKKQTYENMLRISASLISIFTKRYNLLQKLPLHALENLNVEKYFCNITDNNSNNYAINVTQSKNQWQWQYTQ